MFVFFLSLSLSLISAESEGPGTQPFDSHLSPPFISLPNTSFISISFASRHILSLNRLDFASFKNVLIDKKPCSCFSHIFHICKWVQTKKTGLNFIYRFCITTSCWIKFSPKSFGSDFFVQFRRFSKILP